MDEPDLEAHVEEYLFAKHSLEELNFLTEPEDSPPSA